MAPQEFGFGEMNRFHVLTQKQEQGGKIWLLTII